MKFAWRKTLPIGVDLGSTAVKMAQLRTYGGDVQLLAAGLTKVPPHCQEDFSQRLAFFSDSIRNIRKANAFKGRKCVLSLPADAIFLHQVQLPKLPPGQIKEALAKELPYPTNDVILRCEVVGEIYDGGAEAKQELIVVAVAQATRDAYMDMARRGGLYVVAISIEAYAIVNCFARQFHRTSGSTGVVMFIDIGAESTQVVIAHDNSIVFARNLLMGCKQLDPLTNELAKCLRYHETAFRDGGVQTIIFSGGGAYDMDICRVIAKRLNIRAQIGNPLVDIDIAKGFRTNAGLDLGDPIPDWAVAVGLSLGAMETENTRERCLPAETRI